MKFKAFLATKGITDEAFKTMDVSEQAKLHMEFLDSLDSVSSKEFEDIKTQLKTLETNGATAEQLKSIEAQLKEMKDITASKANQSKTMKDEIKENKEAIIATIGVVAITKPMRDLLREEAENTLKDSKEIDSK